MSELIRRGRYAAVPVRRQTRKELDRVGQAAVVRRRELEAAAEEAQYQLELQSQLAYGEAMLQVERTYDVTDYAKHRATQLNHAIAVESAGNPRLAAIHRGFEETAAVTAELAIYRCGTRR